jgi:hypothetical protein
MNNWKCNVCDNEIDKSNKARHLKFKKHLCNLNNQVESNEQQNDIFSFDETLFEPTNKEKKFKCKICKIKVYDLVEQLKSFSHE